MAAKNRTRAKHSEPSIDDDGNHQQPHKSKSSKRKTKILPFTMQEKLFIGISSFIAIYEIAFWLLFDYPVTLHSRGKTPLYALLISASLNSVPHLFCGAYGLLYISRSFRQTAYLLYKQRNESAQCKDNAEDKEALRATHKQQLKELRRKYHKGGLRFSIYIVYLILFIFMQCYFWWLPYFFGIITDERLQRMKHNLKGIVSVLPSNDEYLVPSAEHTALFPLSVISLILAVRMFLKYQAAIITQVRTRWVNYGLLFSFSGIFCYLPLSLVLYPPKAGKLQQSNDGPSSAEPSEDKGLNAESQLDIGAMIIAACVITGNVLFYIGLFRTPKYIQEIRQKVNEAKKKQ